MSTLTATHTELNTDTLRWMYETMVTIRRFEEQARREADAGKLRGMHSSIGQEAVPTGICAHLRDDDYVLGTHRSHHHCIAKGVDLSEMMAELLGKSTGTNNGKGGTMAHRRHQQGYARSQWGCRLEHSGCHRRRV